MSFCTSCGAQMPEGAKFCTNCGAPAQSNAAATRSVPQPDAAPSYAQPQSYAQPYQQQNYYTPAYQQPQQQNYYTPSYQQPQQSYAYAPARQLKTNRGLLKLILLSIITLGIYGIVVMSGVSTDINLIATRYDGKKTMHYCLVLFVFSWLTCGIVPIIWNHRISERIGTELARRGIDYKFGADTYWGWGFFGTLILVGPFIFTYKLLKSMNLLCADYNARG